MNLKALYATFILGLQFFWHILRKLVGLRSPGLKVFLENYRDDGIPAMQPGEKALLYEMSRCVACRLCDELCPLLPFANPADFMGPAFYPASASRHIPDYPYVNLDPQACETCAGCDRICPRHVPIVQTFEMMRQKAKTILK